jgi:hypothetical protein
MAKHYGKKNKGFAVANWNRTERAIRKAKRAGRHPATDKKLAEMMDRLYGTDWLKRQKETAAK